MKFILPEAKRYSDPFERAIYLHCNVAYLQYFRDGNKRAARLLQTAALVQWGSLPLFFKDTLIDKYKRATVHYYETGKYDPYVSFFKENYELAVARLCGVESFAQYEQSVDRWPERLADGPDDGPEPG